MNTILKAAIVAAAASAMATSANAAIVLSSVTPGTNPYVGPVTYDFETPAPVSGGIVTNVSNGDHAQPYGSTGNYWSIGPSGNGLQPGILDLSSFADIANISFIWGSVDSYNTLEFLDASNNVLATFSGNDIFNPANGNQTDPNTNPVVTFTLTGNSMNQLAALRLTSTSNAFETDNYHVTSLPEPATWAMMLLGFGAVGYSMRRRKVALPQFA